MKFKNYGNGIAKGMSVTIKHLFRHPITTQYPEQKLVVSRRIRGNELVWLKDQCTVCRLCARACPMGVISIVGTLASGEFHFEADMGYCIFCGLCVESCPKGALCMGYGYECAKYRREDLLINQENPSLTKEKLPSGFMRPEIEQTLPEQTLLLERDRIKIRNNQDSRTKDTNKTEE